MADMIKVRAVRNEGVRVFQEEHPEHPNGAIDIWSNEGTHAVALTPGIQQQIDAGNLRQVDAPEVAETQEASAVLGERITRKVVDEEGDEVTHIDLDAIPDDVDHVDLPDGGTLDRVKPTSAKKPAGAKPKPAKGAKD